MFVHNPVLGNIELCTELLGLCVLKKHPDAMKCYLLVC
jgi:hypothetical protein